MGFFKDTPRESAEIQSLIGDADFINGYDDGETKPLTKHEYEDDELAIYEALGESISDDTYEIEEQVALDKENRIN